MKYLIVDALGTGIRDEYSGEYISPKSIDLSDQLIQEINNWLTIYTEEMYKGYKDLVLIEKLDEKGREIALNIKNELQDVKVSYFSDAKMEKYIL
jgi:hypothetical protein